ncbi:hypothetical protein CROQUDRAFT_710341, partial [Cronartium quercuum f. sp. fusiforme G11]
MAMETAFGRGVEEEVEENIIVVKKTVNNPVYNSASSVLVSAKSNRDGGLETKSKEMRELEVKMEKLARENEELRNGGNGGRGGYSGGYNGGRGGNNGLGGNRGGYGGNNYQGRGGYNGGNGYNNGYNNQNRGGYGNNNGYNNGGNNLQRYPNNNNNSNNGKTGVLPRNDFNRQDGDFCSYCGGEGHTSRNCAACRIDMENKLVTTDGQNLYLPNGKKLDMTKDRY